MFAQDVRKDNCDMFTLPFRKVKLLMFTQRFRKVQMSQVYSTPLKGTTVTCLPNPQRGATHMSTQPKVPYKKGTAVPVHVC